MVWLAGSVVSGGSQLTIKLAAADVAEELSQATLTVHWNCKP
jgi:hypothetical protein